MKEQNKSKEPAAGSARAPQLKKGRYSDAAARRRCEQFSVNLQYAAPEWLALGTTKTGAVYRFKDNPPTSHE
jgi:hypothetical protein